MARGELRLIVWCCGVSHPVCMMVGAITSLGVRPGDVSRGCRRRMVVRAPT